ncbi:MAG: ATP-dependent zinc metalloprotease FtsH [Verrucomicrobiae bacterium]|nr:ATP-dependent zinc metalloprotease FtsH [Verrucomicrobiae bacterium]
MNWRSLLLFSLAMLLMLLFVYARQGAANLSKELSYQPEFLTALKEDRIKSVEIVVDNSTGEEKLRGKYVVDGKERDFWVAINLNFNRDLYQTLNDSKVPVKMVYSTNWLASGLFSFLPVLLILLILYFMFRQQIKMAGKSAFNFGKSRSKMVARDKNRVFFKDVAGVEEAKEEVQEIVEFLKDPKKFQKLGGKIPKGVLMVGPPGTGKTLLAKAIAGEADVPFFSISGSDFVEMFVGVGASRVRDLFEQGKRNAPCLIFIDEIDAVGRSRGHGVGGGNDEREQTLNALLVEMDGFDTQEGIIIIAATNRKDVLDPALLRPGRFDREVHINLPDIKGREEILKVHAQKIKLSADVDLAVIARGTPGYSGAELANVINEAALLAAKYGKAAVTQPELEEARDKVRWGRERRSMAMTLEEKKTTAYHEAGHAILNLLLENTDPLHKVSIIPRGPALGVTMMLPEADRYNTRRKELVDDLCVTMGGRVAEEVFLGDISSGASGDIRQATWYARKMVCEWGMSEKMGMIQYDEREDLVFLGRDIGRNRSYSEETQREIDHEVKKLIDDAYSRAKKLVSENRDKLEAIAKALLEYETLDGQHIKEILEHGRLINPPSKPTPPKSESSSSSASGEKKGEKDKGDFQFPEGLNPAPIGA